MSKKRHQRREQKIWALVTPSLLPGDVMSEYYRFVGASKSLEWGGAGPERSQDTFSPSHFA